MNGSTLTKTVDSLTPITPDIIDKYDEVADEADEAEEEEEESTEVAAPAVAGSVSGVTMRAEGGVLKLYIGEGKDIAIEFPL